jgi:hypothetical protein
MRGRKKVDYNAIKRPPNLVEVQEKRTPFREYLLQRRWVGCRREWMEARSS